MSDARINYVELAGPAMEATKAFYAAAFGWEWQEYGPEYAAAWSGETEIGLNAGAQVAPPHEAGEQSGVGPLVLFQTSDLGACVSAVEAAGGTITSAPYDYPGGRRFHFADPSGNILGAYAHGG